MLINKYEVKVKFHGSVNYKGQTISSTKIVDEYDLELVDLAEQKLITVKKIQVESKPEKKETKKIKELD
jgi:hypothetical protein